MYGQLFKVCALLFFLIVFIIHTSEENDREKRMLKKLESFSRRGRKGDKISNENKSVGTKTALSYIFPDYTTPKSVEKTEGGYMCAPMFLLRVHMCAYAEMNNETSYKSFTTSIRKKLLKSSEVQTPAPCSSRANKRVENKILVKRGEFYFQCSKEHSTPNSPPSTEDSYHEFHTGNQNYASGGEASGICDAKISNEYFKPIHTEGRRELLERLNLNDGEHLMKVGFGDCLQLTTPRRVFFPKLDGNCFFSAVSYYLTGSPDSHLMLRERIVEHMGSANIRRLLETFSSSRGFNEHQRACNMKNDGVWATDIEIAGTANFLGLDLLVHTSYGWMRYPASLRFGCVQFTKYAVYLLLDPKLKHFLTVLSISPPMFETTLDQLRGLFQLGLFKKDRLDQAKDRVLNQAKFSQAIYAHLSKNHLQNLHLFEEVPSSEFHDAHQNPFIGYSGNCDAKKSDSFFKPLPKNIAKKFIQPKHSGQSFEVGFDDCPQLTTPAKTYSPPRDGNSFFSAVSYYLTGQPNYHSNLRDRIVQHMNNPQIQESLELFCGGRVENHLRMSNMAADGVWATACEIAAAANFLRLDFLAYTSSGYEYEWVRYPASLILGDDHTTEYAVYLKLEHRYFITVLSVSPLETLVR